MDVRSFFRNFDSPPIMSAQVHRFAPTLLWTPALGISPPPLKPIFKNLVESGQVTGNSKYLVPKK